jgi:hypothetical protein
VRTSIWILVIAACVACAGRQIPVENARIGTSDIEHLSPAAPESRPEGEKRPPLIYPPEPLQQEAPEYPREALDSEVSCAARLLYHVESDGSASLVRLEWEKAPPEKFLATFDAAIRAAVAAWEFEPAQRVEPEKLPNGAIEPKMTPVPSAHRALIRFRVVDGRGVVE